MDWTWILTLGSIVGVVLNVKKKRACFYIWAVTNFSWMVIDYINGIYSQAFLFGVCFGLAIWGIVSWKE